MSDNEKVNNDEIIKNTNVNNENVAYDSMNNKNKTANNKKLNSKIIGIFIFTITICGLGIFLGVKSIASKSDENLKDKDFQYKKVEQYIRVVKDEVIAEVGSELPKVSDYYEYYTEKDEEDIKYYFGDKEISVDDIAVSNDNVNYLKEVKDYKVVINDEDETTLKVVDTTKPEVTLQEVTITEGDTYDIKSFVLEYKDNSNISEYVIKYVDESNGTINKAGTYDITLTVCDLYENCVEATTRLIVNKKPSSTVKPKNPPTPTTPSERTFVGTVQEKVITKSEVIKYGTKKNYYVMVTYNTYSDGSKEEVSRTKEKQEIDFSSFNGTIPQMKVEAESLYANLETTRITILDKTNEYRRNAEDPAPALTLDRELSIVATIKAIEMAYSNKFDHTRPSGKVWYTLHDEYFGGFSYSYLAENIAYNYATDLGACEGWKNSPGHYQNMINKNFTKIGIGKYTLNGVTYYVQEFGG